MSLYVRGDIFGYEVPSLQSNKPAQPVSTISVKKQEPITVTTDWQKQFLDKNSPSSDLKGNAKTVSTPAAEEKLTTTELLGRAFLTKFGELEQSGLSSDAKSVESVMTQLSAEAISNLPQPKTYTAADIKTTSDTQVSLATYAKSISMAFATYTPASSEAAIATKALTDENMEVLKEVDPIIASYKSLIAALKAVPAPKALTEHHIALMNNVSLALYNAEAIRHIDADPVRGLASISMGVATMQNIANILYSVNDYLVAAGVKTNS